ncbi:MAG TPA: YafY family protein [Solirubrobacter sp.]|nr:YafY family protein [Solirubrobacter sp.]
MTKAERVLALLEALQDRPSATGPELAERLGVDVRTLRRDVASLRALGIPVEGERGRGGSYRLRPGYRVPPLMFTAGEAAVVALGLMAARRLGLETDGALAKVRRALPDRVRVPVESLEHTLGFTGSLEAAPPDAETLLTLADASRRGRRVTARYTDSAGVKSSRELSPHGVVAHSGRWYVPAFDHARGELRALRADRVSSVRVGGRGEPAPEGFDAVAFVSRMLARVPWAHEVEVVLHTDFESASRRFPPTLAELVARSDGVLLRLRAESLDWAAGLLAGAGCSFTVVRPEALRAHLAALASRLAAA